MKLEFSRQMFEKTHISNFMKIRPEGEDLFHAGGRSNKHEGANSTFSQCCESA
jgi:hypothetical protein